MNPMIDSLLQPPADAVQDSDGVLGAMRSLAPGGGMGDALGGAMLGVQEAGPMDATSKDIPSWQGANPFKDDNGEQHLDYDPDGSYGVDGLGGQHSSGGPMGMEQPGVPGMSPQQPGGADHLRDALLQQAMKNKQLSAQYQDQVGQQNEQEDLQGQKLLKPAPGY